MGNQHESTNQQETTDQLDAAWFDVGVCNVGVMNLPVVKVHSWSEKNGNYWRCEEVEAVPGGLVQCHGGDCPPSERHQWQQV